jgi:hypothetical protein
MMSTLLYYPLGTRVKIKEDSRFYGQSYTTGTIIPYSESKKYEISKHFGRMLLWMRILFDDGIRDTYTYEDLTYIGGLSNEGAIFMLDSLLSYY